MKSHTEMLEAIKFPTDSSLLQAAISLSKNSPKGLGGNLIFCLGHGNFPGLDDLEEIHLNTKTHRPVQLRRIELHVV